MMTKRISRAAAASIVGGIMFMSGAAMAAPATPAPAPSCPAETASFVMPERVQGPPTASHRVLAVVARNQPLFSVDIAFEGPFAGGMQQLQVELMRSVADELGLPGAPAQD